MVRRTDTRQRLLDTAAELFHAQGYHATGLNQLVVASGAPKGSLYFHFPGGKEHLAAESMRLSGARLCEALRNVITDAESIDSAVRAVIDLLIGMLTESDFEHGCPLAAVTLDTTGSEPIRQACAEGYESWRDLIVDLLSEHGLDADRATELATVALASIEGGLLLAKATHDIAPLHAVADHLCATLAKESS